MPDGGKELERRQAGRDAATEGVPVLDAAQHLGAEAHRDRLGQRHLVRNMENDFEGGVSGKVQVSENGDAGRAQIVNESAEELFALGSFDGQRKLHRCPRAGAAFEGRRILGWRQAEGLHSLTGLPGWNPAAKQSSIRVAKENIYYLGTFPKREADVPDTARRVRL